jgi:SAM-dependent methyltransferase
MYDKQYAEKWIKHAESGDEYFRTIHLTPFIRKVVESADDSARILDIGCGWGEAIGHLKPRQQYCGTDRVARFFSYIRQEYAGRKMDLVKGNLPFNVPFDSGTFDLVLCTMVLHCVEELEDSIDTLFFKARKGGEVVIADFRDKAEPHVRGAFLRVDESSSNHISGLYPVSPRVSIDAEAYFHKENQFEQAIKKHGGFKKKYLGPLFVGYKARRK